MKKFYLFKKPSKLSVEIGFIIYFALAIDAFGPVAG